METFDPTGKVRRGRLRGTGLPVTPTIEQMSKVRGLASLSLQRTIVLAVAAAALVVAAGCAGSDSSNGGSSNKEKRPPRTSLPPGGTAEVLHGSQKGLTLKAVVYGASGEVKNPRFDLTPKSGDHFIAVKVGLRNLGTKPYSGNPRLSASVTSNNGSVSEALDIGARGFGQVDLKPSDFVLGRLFFEVPDDTRLSSFSFRPFPGSKPAIFTITHGKSADSERSSKPLPDGGTRKMLRGTQAGSVITAVVYGSSGHVDDSAVAATPHAGSHFIAIKVGLRNLGKRLYSIDPAVSAAIENNKGELSRAIKGAGIGQVELEKGETAFGRVFFELADDTKVSSFRFRPFGAKGKLAVLGITHGQSQQITPSPKPLPDGCTRKVVKRGKTTLKAVVYGSTGSITPDVYTGQPRAGNHIVAIKFGIRNMEGGLYRADPTLSASITNDEGVVSKALPSEGRGIGKIALKQDQGVYGRIFFEVKDKTVPNSFRFRPFGTQDKALVFAIEHGPKHPIGTKLPTETKLGTPDPLPSGGMEKVVTHGGTTVKAVVYGAEGDVPDTKFAVKPPSGYHLTAMRIGLRNTGPGTYEGTPFLVTSLTNTRGEVSKALHSRYGLGKVVLKPDRGVYGRVFFQIEDHTKPASVGIRVFGFGPGTKTTVFTIEHGNNSSSNSAK
jgi:hypothetical protein